MRTLTCLEDEPKSFAFLGELFISEFLIVRREEHEKFELRIIHLEQELSEIKTRIAA